MKVIRSFLTFTRTHHKVVSIFFAILIGLLFPTFNQFSFLIQYLLMAMLFYSFLDLNLRETRFPKQLIYVLLANITLGSLAYWFFSLFDPTLGLAAFITAIAPTAISSTVIIGFLKGDVGFVSSAVVLTNIGVALFVPFVLPFLVHSSQPISTFQMLRPVLLTLFLPFVLTRLVRLLPKNANAIVKQTRPASFGLWLITLVIVVAKAAHFIENQPGIDRSQVGWIALISLFLCVLNFWVGYHLGGKQYSQEASQALGQKNNSFVVWIALTFISPVAALGPTFYILYHNIYNSWQIVQLERRERSNRVGRFS